MPTTFDPVLWRERAWERYQRAVARGEDGQSAVKRWSEDSAYIPPLNSVVEWCTERGIEVLFVKRGGGVYFSENKRIKISGRLRPKAQLHFLLHECGHHLIGDRDKRDRYGMGYSQDDPNVQRTWHHRCDIVDEEFEAWHRGWKLAKRLGLRVSKADYDTTRVHMLKTYMKWALKIDGYGKDDDKDDDDEDEAVAGRRATRAG